MFTAQLLKVPSLLCRMMSLWSSVSSSPTQTLLFTDGFHQSSKLYDIEISGYVKGTGTNAVVGDLC